MPRSLTAQPSRASIAISMKRFESNSCAGPRASPGDTSSLPVENTATRRRRRTSSCVRPSAAVSATSCGRSVVRPATRRSGRNILSCRPHIGAGLEPGGQHDIAGLIELHVFLHEHGVGALGHRRAGENAHGVARQDRRARRRARLNSPDYGKRLLAGERQIGAAHRITIDGRIGEWRQRQWRGDIRGENAAIRLARPARFQDRQPA